MSEGFRVEHLGGISVWTFDRPQARNAIDEDMALGLEKALEHAEQDRTLRAVVLTGSGDAAFVSGADLKFLRDASPERRANNDTRMLALMDRLEALPVPVIAALNGAVVGGGSEIALACDLRIAEPHASITLKHAAMGVSPGWGGLARLSGLVGRSPCPQKKPCAWAWSMKSLALGAPRRARSSWPKPSTRCPPAQSPS
jgi:enoyl-CoA hydratase/carnithine racemase